jgi:hypothetical protein
MGYIEVFRDGEDMPPIVLGDHYLKDVVHDPYAKPEQWITCQMYNVPVLVTDIRIDVDLDNPVYTVWQCVKCHAVNG